MRASLAFSSILNFVALAAAVLMSVRPIAAASVNDFVTHNFLDSNNNVLLPGRLHVPAAYSTDPHTIRPLILFLHGAGESGTNNIAQINGNLDNLLAAAKNRGAFLYAPQTNSGWGSPTLLSRAMTMIDRAIVERHVDPNRIYVTGLSMGGGGVWNILNQFPDRFAAAVPICSVSPSPSFLPANIVNEPIWAFHARNDGTVSPTASRNVINRLLSEALEPLPAYPSLTDFSANFNFNDSLLDLHYTEYRTGGHGIWGQVYNTPAVYDWMFAHVAIPEPATVVLLMISATSMCLRGRRTA
jgi:predicted peptidase